MSRGGCNDPAFGAPDEHTIRDVEKCGIKKPALGLAAPPVSYVDQGLTIDYARIGYEPCVDKIMADPRMLEQVYSDAEGGNVTARWSVCLFEATSRGAGRRAAEKLAGLRCQTIARCSCHPDDLPYSDTTRRRAPPTTKPLTKLIVEEQQNCVRDGRPSLIAGDELSAFNFPNRARSSARDGVACRHRCDHDSLVFNTDPTCQSSCRLPRSRAWTRGTDRHR